MRGLLNVEQALHLLFERDVAEGNADPESEPESDDFDDEGDDPSFVLEEEREEKQPRTSAPSGTRRSAQRRERRSAPTRSRSPLSQAAEPEPRLHSEPWKTEEDADTAPAVSRFQPRRTPGVQIILHLMASGEGDTQTGVLIPMPCPHTLPPLLDMSGVTLVPYQLMEDQGWAVDLHELQRALRKAKGRCEPRAIYISNPGNPTGHVQDRKTIEEVIRFAATEGLVLLAEEVYQDCVYGQGQEFISYKRVLFEMGQEYSETVELISFHSISSACMGECGLRGGYMEIINMDPAVSMYLKNVPASPPVLSQLALEVMVNPPTAEDPSYKTYSQEILHSQTTLSQNAQHAYKFLNDLPGMNCQPAMGGVFLYPCLHLPPQMIEEAEMLGVEADVLYCQRLLEEQGVCLGAGCENGQEGQNYHIRLCVLAPPATLEEVLARLRSFHLHLLDRFP